LRVHESEQGVQDFQTAQVWLQRATDLLKEPLAYSERCLQLSRIRYYQGKMSFIAKDFEQSKSYFREALRYAQAIQWQRVVHRVRNWLADIAIQQENFAEAEQLLLEEVHIAEQNQDIHQLAFDQQSLATLARAQNKEEMAKQWGLAALKSFETLNMESEVKAATAFLQDLRQDR
jgi:tetratricopeptide (TPR) repeat protein